MVSRNQLLGQMQRPKTNEELLNELATLQRGVPHLTPKQEARLEELRIWHKGYLKTIEPEFRSWIFHPTKGEKIVESREDFDQHIKDGWYGTRAELKEAADGHTPSGRQKIIETEFKEEVEEERQEADSEYIVFLQRSMQKESGLKLLYYYTVDELRDVYKKLGLEFDEALVAERVGRIKLYQKLKNYIELNT